MGKEIINADDFGLSRGVNEAVLKMHKEKTLTSASLMVTTLFADEAAKIASQNKTLKVGLHFNLTTGKSALSNGQIPLLVDSDGHFKNGFLKLLLLSIIYKKKFLNQVEAELKAQIKLAKSLGITTLSHIDGHRHVHFIPGIFAVVCKAAKKEKIKRVRIINESLFHTLKLGFFPSFSGLIKWFILRLCGIFNKKYIKDFKNEPYFFSIIHSCKITKEMGDKFKIPKGFRDVEFMIHPSIRDFDKLDKIEYESDHLMSHFRDEELNFKKPKI